jgi:hypothetical protein
MTAMDQVRRDRLAQNESSFRSINEDLERGLHSVRLEDGERVGFVCECSDTDCANLVHIELAKYEEIRSDSRRFLVVPGHEMAEVEDVVETDERYCVVQKHADVSGVVERGDARRG